MARTTKTNDPVALKRKGWRAWVRSQDRATLKTDEERAGWDLAARENDRGGPRPRQADAETVFPAEVR